MLRSVHPKVLFLILLIQFLTFNSPSHVASKNYEIASEPTGCGLIVGVRGMTGQEYLKQVRLIEEYGKVKDRAFFGGMLEALVISLPATRTLEFVQKMSELKPSYIQTNMLFKACMVPNDPCWKLQWSVWKIHADYA
jgi:hypothetical protein